MKKRLLMAVVALMLLTVTACSKPAQEKKEEPVQEEQQKAEEPKEEEKVEEKKVEEKKETGTVDSEWTEMEFIFDGVNMKLLETPYKTLEENGWTFNMADYGYEDGYILNPKDKLTSTIDLTNEKYLEDKYAVRVSAGFINTTDGAVDVTESNVWAIQADVSSAMKKGEPYPDFVLAGGITWGATYEEIKAAYGEPSEEPYRSEDLGYYTYEYKNEYSQNMRFVVYDEMGLTEIDIHNYGN
ncbi:putative small lipoprotein YifL [Aequitasia blattaphilus]|uniref:Lipoprotein n=1 Tax=Aequitasia blattaphilus TaxID=2949332 RepID=A0ABT1E815_9FIRM|nr:hypothetical protein [Aequitasia blattaphilus]MCP1101928.1 hypothetical protein [Aequitasia blattaphilus]MCR8614568.1 hypothetical protein [Aequitasia blattaphilus]